MTRLARLLVITTSLLALNGAEAQVPSNSRRDKVTPAVREAMREPGSTIRIIVRMRAKASSPVRATFSQDSAAMRIALRREQARKAASPLLSFLRRLGGSRGKATPSAPTSRPRASSTAPSAQAQELWIANSVCVDATPEMIRVLAGRRDVERVYRDIRVQAIPPSELRGHGAQKAEALGNSNWGLEKIRAPEAWDTYGFRGEGIVVGHIDTGVDGSHPALAGRVIKFKDFVNSRTRPYDDEGHGTHTAGSICASGSGLGVAPGARLIVAKALDSDGSGELSKLLEAMQWMLDPDGDPSTNDRPVCVSNSWGIDRSVMKRLGAEETFFWDAVQAWRDANIIPVFSSGNSGHGTEAIPAAYPIALAVGATNQLDGVPSFSTGGQSRWNGMTYTKPDLSAPGHKVLSTVPGNKLRSLNGTSMAAPHVAGTIALIKQARPAATISEIEQILKSSLRDLGPQGLDDRFGLGRIDVYAAVAIAQGEAPPPVVTPAPPAPTEPDPAPEPPRNDEIKRRVSRGILILAAGLFAAFGFGLFF